LLLHLYYVAAQLNVTTWGVHSSVTGRRSSDTLRFPVRNNACAGPAKGDHTKKPALKKVQVEIVMAFGRLNFKGVEAQHDLRSKGAQYEKYNSWLGAWSGAAFWSSAWSSGCPRGGDCNPG
jgi:hypothetical protein